MKKIVRIQSIYFFMKKMENRITRISKFTSK